jgi:hypothetical protein
MRQRLSNFAGRLTVFSLCALLLATTISVGSLAVTGPQTALAQPTNCTYTVGFTYVKAKCTGGTGSFRVIAKCRHPLFFDLYYSGNWANVGGTSTLWCGLGDVVRYGVEKRN